MKVGFDFSTSDVLDWEIEAIWKSIDEDELIFSRHATQELSLDALTYDDVIDAIFFYDSVEKDLPDNTFNRAAGVNFDRNLDKVTVRVKIGWNKQGYYVVITVMSN